MPDIRWTTKSGCHPQARHRGPFRKRTLNMVCICLSLAALGLVSLAGGEVRQPSHLKTASETFQFSQPAANIRARSLEDLSIRGRFPDLQMSHQDRLPESQAPRQHLLSVQSQTWTASFGGCIFSGDFAGAPLVRTGSCPTQGGYLDLQRKGITSVQPDAFEGISQLTYLDLSNNQLSALPPNIFTEFSSLGGLDLNNNSFSALPRDIFAGLSSLQQLWLSNNQLSALPPGVFAGLSSLGQLGLHHNQLSALPPGVFEGLSSLQMLYLNNNQLSALPPGVFDGLSSLQTLWLSFNQLSVLPLNIFDGLFWLGELVLGHNQLSALPPGVFDGLSSLRTLHLDNNLLQCVLISAQHAPLLGTGRYHGPRMCTSIQWTVAFGGCTFSGDYAGAPLVRTGSCPTQGGSLDLQSRFITSVPPDAFQGMPQMTYLHLFDNQLSALPLGVFAGLSSLVSLSLTSNQLSALPSGVFAGLSSLQQLWLSSNQLSALPPDIFSRLSSLGSLSLTSNQLSALPPGVFAGLSSLQQLYLANNQLSALPPGVFAGLSSLQTLWLSNNLLSVLPLNIFAGLSSLGTLHLDNNLLQCAPISAALLGSGRYQGPGLCTPIQWTVAFGGCTFSGDYAGAPLVRTGSCPTQGGSLDLQSRFITSVPPDAFQDMPQMTYLVLSNNQLSALPPGVFDGLSSLQRLYLNNNQLSVLPLDIFAGLSSLQYLYLDGNHLLCTVAVGLTTCTCNAGLSGTNFNCIECAAGKYNAGQTSTEASCTACGAGKYGVATGQTDESSCTACGAGKYGVATGQTAEASCTACGAGKYGVETGGSAEASCTACSTGKYGSGASSCSVCPPNSNSVPGSTSVTDCTCSAGSTGPSGGPCLQCAAGKFKIASGTDICTNCIIGKYGAAGAATETECRTCPAGKFAGREGSSQCTDCEAGKFSDGEDIVCKSVKVVPAAGAATHVVKLTLSLPLAKNEFTTDKQSKFRESIAAAAGAKFTDVTIDRIDTIVNIGRRLLSEYVLVYTSVMVSDAKTADAMANSLTVDKINGSLRNTGLPKATLKQAATVETLSTVTPVESVNTITAPLIGGIVGGLVLLIVFVTGASVVYLRYLTKDKTRRFHNAVGTLDTNHDGHISEVRYIAFLCHDRGRDRLDRDNHARVLRIKGSMHCRGVPVWIDDDQLSGHVDAKVCEGIDQSSVVLLFVTKNFILKVGGKSQRGEGDFCLLEFNYAKLNKTSKKMLCVVMEPQCLNQLEWSGPLMMHMGGSLFFDFSTDDDFEGKMNDLVKMMQEIVSPDEWQKVTKVYTEAPRTQVYSDVVV